MQQQLVVFSLGDEEYGLPITQVQEIIRYAAPRTIPSAPTLGRAASSTCAARSSRSAT